MKRAKLRQPHVRPVEVWETCRALSKAGDTASLVAGSMRRMAEAFMDVHEAVLHLRQERVASAKADTAILIARAR